MNAQGKNTNELNTLAALLMGLTDEDKAALTDRIAVLNQAETQPDSNGKAIKEVELKVSEFDSAVAKAKAELDKAVETANLAHKQLDTLKAMGNGNNGSKSAPANKLAFGVRRIPVSPVTSPAKSVVMPGDEEQKEKTVTETLWTQYDLMWPMPDPKVSDAQEWAKSQGLSEITAKAQFYKWKKARGFSN